MAFGFGLYLGYECVNMEYYYSQFTSHTFVYLICIYYNWMSNATMIRLAAF